jgi:hypothetical protein
VAVEKRRALERLGGGGQRRRRLSDRRSRATGVRSRVPASP